MPEFVGDTTTSVIGWNGGNARCQGLAPRGALIGRPVREASTKSEKWGATGRDNHILSLELDDFVGAAF